MGPSPSFEGEGHLSPFLKILYVVFSIIAPPNYFNSSFLKAWEGFE
jgi:hypothetical protein